MEQEIERRSASELVKEVSESNRVVSGNRGPDARNVGNQLDASPALNPFNDGLPLVAQGIDRLVERRLPWLRRDLGRRSGRRRRVARFGPGFSHQEALSRVLAHRILPLWRKKW